MPKDDDPVFFNYKGERIRSFKKGLAELLIAADLRVGRNGKLRDSFSFRHFYITQQIREGVEHRHTCVSGDGSPPHVLHLRH